MANIIDAFKLVEEEKLPEAYDAFSDLIEEKVMVDEARYSRAMLDISHLRCHFDNTINDLKELIEHKTKYAQVSYSFLTLVYDELEMVDETITYGRLAIKKGTPFVNEIHFTLARALARRGSKSDLEEALKMIDVCLKQEETSEELDYLICKTDILISLVMFDEALNTIDLIIKEYGYSGTIYYLKARLAIKKYYQSEDPSLLDDVINNSQIAIQYEEGDYFIKSLLIEAYTIKKAYDEALKVIDTLPPDASEEDIIMEKVKIYDEMGKYQEALDIIKPYLASHTSWKLKYMEGALLLDLDNTKMQESVNCFKEAYQLYHHNGIMADIVKFNHLLDQDQDTFDYLMVMLKENENGALYFYLAETALRIDRPYEDIINYYKKACELNYIAYDEYLDIICNYIYPSKKINKLIKKQEKASLKGHYLWSRRKVAIRYIYQEDGYKQNLPKAKKILEQCLIDFRDTEIDSCLLSLFGRCLDLLNLKKDAFQYYLKAYNLIKDETDIYCDCAYGYYAYAKLLGIGTLKDEEEAKQVILEIVAKNKRYTTSHIAYLYAYFFLIGDERFDGKLARTILESNYPFYRFEISRIVILHQVTKKLKVKSPKLEELIKDLTVFPQDDLQYFKENFDQEASLPYWRNI